MRKAAAPMLVLTMSLLVPLTGCQKIQARAEIKKGNKYYKDENYKDALARFQAGLQLDPGITIAQRSVGLTAMALYKPGVESAENKKYADLAIDAFQKYLQGFPQDIKTEEFLINTWVMAGRYDAAISYLKNEASQHPENTKLNGAIVNVMIKAVRFKDALDWVNAKSRNDAQLYYNVATQAWSKSYNDPTFKTEDRIVAVDIGLQAIQRATEVKQDYMEAMVYYGLLYREKAKLDPDPKNKDQWTAKSIEWRDKALAVKEKQKAAAAQKKS